MDRSLKVIYEPIEKIKPYKHNAKIHTEEQINQIVKSIHEFGFNDPIAVDEDYTIIEGHGRLKAAEQMGMAEVPIIILDGLTDQQKKAYILAHNQLTMNTGFDLNVLADELDRITAFDMMDFGFDMTTLFGEEDKNPEEVKEDEPPAPPTEPKAKEGDIYQLGNHRLMCGDSTKAEDVERLMNGEKADLVVTDPPYNAAYGTKKNQGNRQIINDNMSDDDFFVFCKEAFSRLNEALKDNGAFYIWYGDTKTAEIYNGLIAAGLKPRAPLVWVKDRMTLSFNDYHNQNEPCIYSWKGTNHYFTEDRTQKTLLRDDTPDFSKLKKEELIDIVKEFYEYTDAIHEAKPQKSDLHPTMKPIKLLARLIRNSSRQGELVLDLFGGSGSTMIACEQMGRRCNMMELDPKYVDVIIERWEKLTGEKAKKLN